MRKIYPVDMGTFSASQCKIYAADFQWNKLLLSLGNQTGGCAFAS